MEENIHQTLEDLVVLAEVVVVETTMETLEELAEVVVEYLVQVDQDLKVDKVLISLVLEEVAEDGHLVVLVLTVDLV